MDGTLPTTVEAVVDPSLVYWADAPVEQLIPHLDQKCIEYTRALDRLGLRVVWRMAYSQLHGMDPSRPGHLDREVGFEGEKGEHIVFRINDFRSFLKQSVSMALGQRPSFKCLAANDDYESLAQIESCDSAITYVHNRAYGEDLEREKVRLAKICGWSWDWHRWDDDAGDEVETQEQDQPTTSMVKSGLPSVSPKAAWEVAHDPSCKDGRHTWLIVSEWRSKWELAAECPVGFDGEDQVAKIVGLSGSDTHGFSMLSATSDGDFMTQYGSDAVMVRHFYHAPTKALPAGRYVGVVGNIPLWDVPLPTREIPCVPFMPSRLSGTSFGYSDAWDWLSLQQMLDQITADRATNVAIFGRPNMYMDEGTTVTVDLLSRGGQLFTKKPGTEAPAVIQYPALNQNAEALTAYLQSRLRENSGLNAVARGDTSSQIKSGQHAALYHAMALEYNSDDQQAVDSSRERNANMVLESIKQNAQYPFLVEVAGISQEPYMDTFESDRFRAVKRVQVVTDSPMLRTTAGKLEMFNATKDIPGAYSDVGQAREMIVSGQYKPTYQAARRNALGVRWENEQMSRGIEVPAAQSGENWMEEIKEHAALKRMPAVRNRPEIVAIIDAHMISHLEAAMMTSPLLAMATGTPPVQGIMAGMNPQPEGDGPEMQGADKMAKREETREMGGMGTPLPKPAQSPAASHVAQNVAAA